VFGVGAPDARDDEVWLMRAEAVMSDP